MELAELDAAVEASRKRFDDARTQDWLCVRDQETGADYDANEEYEQENTKPAPAIASAIYGRIRL